MSEGILTFGVKSRDWKEVTYSTVIVLGTTNTEVTCNSTGGRVSLTGGRDTTTTATLVLMTSPIVIKNNRVSPNSVVIINNLNAMDSLGFVGWAVESVLCESGQFTVRFRNATAGTIAAADTKFSFSFFVLNGAVY